MVMTRAQSESPTGRTTITWFVLVYKLHSAWYADPMFFRLGERMARVLHPFHSIAHSLAIVAELYELELASRVDPKTGQIAPIRRVTEAPSRRDTKVLWTGIDERKVKVDIFADAGEDEE